MLRSFPFSMTCRVATLANPHVPQMRMKIACASMLIDGGTRHPVRRWKRALGIDGWARHGRPSAAGTGPGHGPGRVRVARVAVRRCVLLLSLRRFLPRPHPARRCGPMGAASIIGRVLRRASHAPAHAPLLFPLLSWIETRPSRLSCVQTQRREPTAWYVGWPRLSTRR